MNPWPPRDAPIDPPSTALLIIDAQKGICEPEGGHDSDYFADAIHRRALPNIARLLDTARTAGLEVVFTVIQSLTADGRDRCLDYKLTGFHFPPGSREAQVVDVLRPFDDEIVLPKTSSSVFNSTAIDYVLRNIGIRSVVVAGFQTDQCIDHTMRDGADRGYAMVCATDACAAKSQQRHDNAIALFRGYGRLATTDVLLQEMTGQSAARAVS